MKYLKLFEAWINEPKFFRFSHEDMLNGKSEGEITPTQRVRMIGPEEINTDLVNKGFPDKRNCIHFMSEDAIDPNKKHLWGSNVFEIQVDDKSIIAWTFLLNINDWYYKGSDYSRLHHEQLIKNLESKEYHQYSVYNTEDISSMTNLLLEVEAIGFGTIEDLKKSPWYGKYKYYAWTNDTVYVKKWIEPQKVGKHKIERVLGREHFVDGKEMGEFYKEMGKKIIGLDLNTALDILSDWRNS
jgi:hypothetical protein